MAKTPKSVPVEPTETPHAAVLEALADVLEALADVVTEAHTAAIAEDRIAGTHLDPRLYRR